jgi:hypothetical protein
MNSPSAGPSEWQRRTQEALASLAQEMHHWPTLQPVDAETGIAAPPPERPPEGSRRQLCLAPELKKVVENANRLVARCDGAFRCSTNETAENVQMIRRLAEEGIEWAWSAQQLPRSRELAAACACFRRREGRPPPGEDPFEVDALDLAEALEPERAYELHEDAFGKAGNVVKMAEAAVGHAKMAQALTRALVAELKEPALLGGRCLGLSPEAAYRKLAECITNVQIAHSVRQRLVQRASGRLKHIENARVAWSHFEARANRCVEDRYKRPSLLLAMEDDAVGCMAMYLDPQSALALMLADPRSFARRAEIAGRLPSPRIRPVLGHFPHHRGIAVNRAELVAGKPATKRVESFVLKRTAVRLCIDFGVHTLRPTPLKKVERSDGLDNRYHDFEDDEFEPAPEDLVNRGPQGLSNNHAESTTWHNSVCEQKRKARKKWEALEGPQEAPDRYSYFQRVPHTRYFEDDLTYSVRLVYADDGQPVPCDRYNGALAVGHGDFAPPRPKARGYHAQTAQELPPAQVKLHVPHLSFEHEGKLFRIEVSARGVAKGTGKEVCLTTLSEPFECVSKLDVIQKADKRKPPAGADPQKRPRLPQ